MNRRDFLAAAAALSAAPSFTGCASLSAGKGGRILFGACQPPSNVKLMASVGYDFFEMDVASAFGPAKDGEWWKRQKESILSLPLPLRSSNGFIPGSFRLTGPKADHAPALDYAETALRAIGYAGGVSCECGWGRKEDLAKNLETALKTLRSL